MKSLNEYVWNKYALFGDEGFLNIDSTNSSIDGIRIKSGENNTVPYITRTDNNNGTTRFVAEENYTMGSDPGNCITVGLDTQTAFYQAHRFVTGQNIQVIYGATINKFSALFYTTILRTQMVAKFNWGGNGATLGRMVRLEALLPSAENGNPDFLYMTEYIKAKQKETLDKYRTYAKKQLSQIKYKKVKPISEMEWKPFSIVSLFNMIRGREGNMAMLEDGTIPLVSAKNANNGVKGFVSARKIINGNCITLNNDGDGGAGLAYYQPSIMALDTHVTALIPKNDLNKWSLLFIANCLSQLHGFFGHGLSISNKRAERIKIMLPTNENGKPDFSYMEQYTKNIILRKYQQYLDYLNKKQQND